MSDAVREAVSSCKLGAHLQHKSLENIKLTRLSIRTLVLQPTNSYTPRHQDDIMYECAISTPIMRHRGHIVHV